MTIDHSQNSGHPGHPDQLGFGNNKGYRIYELSAVKDDSVLATIYATDANYPEDDDGEPSTEYWVLQAVDTASLAEGIQLSLTEECQEQALPIEPGRGNACTVTPSALPKSGPPTLSDSAGIFQNTDTKSNATGLELSFDSSSKTLSTIRFYLKDSTSPQILLNTKVGGAFQFGAPGESTPESAAYYYDEQPQD